MKKMTEVEKRQWTNLLRQEQYNYAVTITERDADSVGSVYLSSLQLIENLQKADPDAKAVIIISASANEHAHAHGVVKTTLPQRGVRSCSRGCWVHTTTLYDPNGWYDYILKQGASQATISTHVL